MAQIQLIAFFTVFIVAKCNAAEIYTDCGSSAKIVKVEVTGCKSSPCQLKKGTDITLGVEFVPKSAPRNLRGDIAGVINGVTIPFKKDPQACSHLVRGKCGQSNSSKPLVYAAVFGVPSFAPSVNLDAKWRIKDENGNVVVCLLVPASIH